MSAVVLDSSKEEYMRDQIKKAGIKFIRLQFTDIFGFAKNVAITIDELDKGEDARKDIILTMKKLGFSIEVSHHEVAPGQHEIDFKYGEALNIADKWMTFKQIVKSIAHDHGLYASFIPKPFTNENGNAMHCNQ